MRNLKTVEKKVRAILEKNEDARNDDMVLYLALCNVCLKDAVFRRIEAKYCTVSG